MDVGRSSLICEWLFRLLMPSFFLNISNRDLNSSIFDSLIYINEKEGIEQHLALDLLNHYNSCTNLESKLLYFLWFLNIFQPILSTIVCLLLILPLLVCLIIYVTSLYLFLKKHWRNFKVSVTAM